MIITITGYKGGVSKTTTAVHVATYLAQKGKTVLIDGDPNRSALKWSKRGNFPFTVVDEKQAAKVARQYEHVVIDTEGRPGTSDLEDLATGCDLMLLPITADPLALDSLPDLVRDLKQLGAANYKLILTRVPPPPQKEGEEIRDLLQGQGLPLINASVRERKAFKVAVLQGVPVRDAKYPGALEGWEEYTAVMEEVL